MSFLFPLYFLGAAAIALPLYLHLKRRPPKDAVDFSTLMFLNPTRTVRVKRRSKLENILLLFLRCLAILGLAFIFSRPFLQNDDSGAKNSAAGRNVILIDTSASMQREDGALFQKAIKAAADNLPESPAASAAIFTFDASTHTLIDFDQWAALPESERIPGAKSALKDLKPGYGKTNIGAAILRALEAIGDAEADSPAASSSHRIVLISDLQKSAALEELRNIDWPQNVTFDPVTIEPQSSDNAAMQWIKAASGETPDLRLTNSLESTNARFLLSWKDAEEKLTVDVPPGESRVVHVPGYPGSASAVTLTGDKSTFDNTLWFTASTRRTLRIYYSGSRDTASAQSPFYYISRAFPDTDSLHTQFLSDSPSGAEIIIVPEISSLKNAAEIRDAIMAGATALAVIDPAAKSVTLTEPPITTDAAPDRDYSMLGTIDFEHPALAAFRDPKVRDFTKIRFWKYRSLTDNLPDNAQIIAAYDNEAPAWIRIPMGEGSLILMTSGWTPADSQLARSSKFLPLLYSFFDAGSLATGAAMPTFVGEPLPSETEAPVPAEPGIIAAGSEFFAVNIPPSESEIETLTLDEFAAFGIPAGTSAIAVAEKTADQKIKQQDTEREQKQRLWQWLVLGVFLLLLVETFLARNTQPADESAPETAPAP